MILVYVQVFLSKLSILDFSHSLSWCSYQARQFLINAIDPKHVKYYWINPNLNQANVPHNSISNSWARQRGQKQQSTMQIFLSKQWTFLSKTQHKLNTKKQTNYYQTRQTHNQTSICHAGLALLCLNQTPLNKGESHLLFSLNKQSTEFLLLMTRI